MKLHFIKNKHYYNKIIIIIKYYYNIYYKFKTHQNV